MIFFDDALSYALSEDCLFDHLILFGSDAESTA